MGDGQAGCRTTFCPVDSFRAACQLDLPLAPAIRRRRVYPGFQTVDQEWARKMLCSGRVPESLLRKDQLMSDKATSRGEVTTDELIALLNEDLAREYQAVIAYVVYSQVLKGAEYMNIAAELEKHAAEELAHALILAKQIDYLGGM